jgi:hypothetical protein
MKYTKIFKCNKIPKYNRPIIDELTLDRDKEVVRFGRLLLVIQLRQDDVLDFPSFVFSYSLKIMVRISTIVVIFSLVRKYQINI